ncbi:hypothetical protein QYF61_015557 [Mycteria americana]|uniref:Uncharacterized protein n=1 Tax=Mycteria americana TaxID=33587 RepID=A0AAN7NYB6_MYCAM|nr:hypothetical protein QYF61_015557 [Mycteria americana]
MLKVCATPCRLNFAYRTHLQRNAIADQFHDHRADLKTDVLGQATEKWTAPFKDGNNWFHKGMRLPRLTCCETTDFGKLQPFLGMSYGYTIVLQQTYFTKENSLGFETVWTEITQIMGQSWLSVTQCQQQPANDHRLALSGPEWEASRKDHLFPISSEAKMCKIPDFLQSNNPELDAQLSRDQDRFLGMVLELRPTHKGAEGKYLSQTMTGRQTLFVLARDSGTGSHAGQMRSPGKRSGLSKATASCFPSPPLKSPGSCAATDVQIVQQQQPEATRDGDSTPSLGSLFQCLTTLSVKKNFLISSLNLPWRNLRPFLLVLSLAVVESDEVSPQPPFLQAEQPQFPQPLLISLVLQTLHQLRCPSLDTESQNRIGWKRPLRSSSPTVNLTLPSPPLHHVPTHLIQTSFKYLQGWGLNPFPGQPVPVLDNPFGEVKFPNIQSKPPLVQLEAISSCPITCYLGEETNPHLSTASFQAVVESNKVSPQPPFLQAKQPQFPQPLPISLVLQTLHQLRCPSLNTLQPLNVSLVMRGPKLNTVFEVRPHQCRVQGGNRFPSPAGHTIFDTSQDAIGLLGHLGTLLAHIQPAVDQHPQVLLCQAAFQPLFSKPVALHGVVVTQVQDPALGLVEPHTIDLGPSIQPVQVPLQSLPTLQQINTPAQLGVIC